MSLSPMRFKSFVWPHNPSIYEIQFERSVSVQKLPFGRSVLQDLGLSHRVLQGEGVFVGANAYEQFRSLATVFYQDGPGLLVHPLWQPSLAYFVSLSLKQSPTPNYVAYQFTFWETDESTKTTLTKVQSPTLAPASPKTYVVQSGDTLWHIAQRHGVSLAALLAVNPAIQNPNRIYPNQKVVLP